MQWFNPILPLRWQKKQCFSNQTLKGSLAWLLDPGSLTAKLRKQCQSSFSVRVISQKRRRPRFEESKKLGISMRAWVIVREVELLCDGKAMVIARTVIPDVTIHGKGWKLQFINDQPLIEVLAKDRNLSRSDFELVQFKTKTDWQWVRRSIFYFYGKKVLVTEAFHQKLMLSDRFMFSE